VYGRGIYLFIAYSSAACLLTLILDEILGNSFKKLFEQQIIYFNNRFTFKVKIIKDRRPGMTVGGQLRHLGASK